MRVGPSHSQTVNSGDCLWSIARKNGVSLSQLIAANPQIKNPDLIHPGEKVNIPGAGAAESAPTARAKPEYKGLAGLWHHARDKFVETARGVGGKLGGNIDKLMNIARSQVGTLESGMNAGAITKYTGGKTGWPWCARFFSWVYRQAGMPLPGGDQWAVAGVKSIIQRLGQWKSPSALKPGMAVMFRGFSHIEMIARPVIKNGQLVGYMTYGGNTGIPGTNREGVAYKFRALSIIEGGGYPVKA